MRFATKILLLTLAMTLGLSGLIVWVVSSSVQLAERSRARVTIDRTIDDYAGRVRERGEVTTRLVHAFCEEQQVRSDLDRVDVPRGAEPPVTAVTQLREEVFGRVLQNELTFNNVIAPAAHVLVNRRGAVVLVASPRELPPSLDAKLRGLVWPYEVVVDGGRSLQQYVALEGRLYMSLSVPLRKELRDAAWDFAYFVLYEVDDAWVRTFLRQQDWTDLRVVAVLDGDVRARSASADAVEADVVRIVGNAQPRPDGLPIQLDFKTGGDGEQFLGAAVVFPSANHNAVFAFFSSLDRALAPLQQLRKQIWYATAGVVAVAFAVSRLMSRLFARPVEELVAGTERIARGEFDVPIDTRRRDELGVLARSFNQMAAGLEQRDLIKDTFGKFVDPAIVQSLLDDPSRLKLGGERRVQTILFADLENFTELSERLDPEALFELLNGYLECAADVVAEHRGIVDKFIGDGVVAFWGPPMEEHHALAACRAALKLARRTFEHGGVTLHVRVGVATGEVLVGNIGSRSKYNYTVMGDVANLASRLEGVNKLYGTQVLVTDRTRRDAGPSVVARKIDVVRVLGRREPVELYELLGEADHVNGHLADRIKQYDAALNLYHARRWVDAREAFDRVDDPPARAMAGRCAVLADQAPTEAWDGVWNLDRK